MAAPDRDTHFKRFAESLFNELLTVNGGRIDVSAYNLVDDETIETYRTIIARRAYDLVAHVLNNEKLQWYPMEEISIKEIPDLTEFSSQVDNDYESH